MMAHKATTTGASQRATGSRPSTGPQTTESLDPKQLSLAALVRRCATESDHFYHNRPYDARFAHELFRRALVERDEPARVAAHDAEAEVGEAGIDAKDDHRS